MTDKIERTVVNMDVLDALQMFLEQALFHHINPKRYPLTKEWADRSREAIRAAEDMKEFFERTKDE